MSKPDHDYWRQRWEDNRVGFHAMEVNPDLPKRWSYHLGEKIPQALLVPLCGKSHDMTWLAEQGHEILGVELSEIAAQTFFSEQNLAPTQIKTNIGMAYRHQIGQSQVTILVADYFAVDDQTLSALGLPNRFSFLYDRAATIALPPEIRLRYYKHTKSLLDEHFRGLLVSMYYHAYDAKTANPPFSVSESEILQAYPNAKKVRESDLLAFESSFTSDEFEYVFEFCYSLNEKISES